MAQLEMERIYFDNAATSWPKASGVGEAISDYLLHNGAPAGRSGYAEAEQSARLVQHCRLRLAQFINAPHPSHVAMAFNGTDALNIAIHGLLRPDDHVVTTVLEHNSVLRPLKSWESRGVETTYVEPDRNGMVRADNIADAIRSNTRLVIATHASNVTGVIQPIAEIGSAVARSPALFLVDAAQSLGHVPVDLAAMQIDVLAASGHKGLRGPLGTGIVALSETAADAIQPWRQGGTGTVSERAEQPVELPHRLESGNLNLVGIVGLNAAIQSLDASTVAADHAHEQQLAAHLLTGLRRLPMFTTYGPEDRSLCTGVVSITSNELPAQELCTLLDSSFRIQTRAGLHCAPLAHQHLGTSADGGTLRISFGPANTVEEVDQLLSALDGLTLNF